MGIIRDSFVIFKNWAEAINALPDEYQLETYKALVEYGFNGVIPQNLSPISNAMLISFSAGMENNILRYNASVENGKKGGRPKNPTKPTETENKKSEEIENMEKPNETQQNLEKPSNNLDITKENLDEPNPNLYVNDNVNVNDNVTDNKSLSINNFNLSERVRACESLDAIKGCFLEKYQDEYFFYWGKDEKDKQTFELVIDVIAQSVLTARSGLRFSLAVFNQDTFLDLIEKLDVQDIRDIVWQVMNNDSIEQPKYYILKALINRATEKYDG